jgi:acetyl esterase/lipase
MASARPAAAIGLLAGLLMAGGASVADPVARPGVLRGLPYAGAPDDSDRSLDLFLPAESKDAPPLVAFVHSQFWARNAGGRALEPRFARALQAEGAAVAVIRHRLAPDHPHPAGAEDVAAALAFLIRGADRFGFDPHRVYLSGHSSGAHLAALVALDTRYLEPHGISPDVLAGVIGISGIYDLDPKRELGDEERGFIRQAFGRKGRRRGASPARVPRAGAPPFLMLAATNDIPGLQDEAVDFAEALRDTGHGNAEAFLVVGRDHFTILQLDDVNNAARGHILSFVGLGPLSAVLADLYAARKYWRDPGASTLPFWDHRNLIEAYDADERFLVQLALPFTVTRRVAPLLEAERYHAIDLFAYLAAIDPAASGFLMLTNVRGEQRVFRLDAIRPYAPVIVVGIDDERNLFRVLDLYHRRRESAGGEPVPNERILARPLGGFVHFREAPPREWEATVAGRFALTSESFQVFDEDPWLELRDLSEPMEAVLTRGEGCVSCHTFQGAGGRAGHLLARDGALVGGHGLPLESYTPGVLRRFVFEQAEVAAELGAPPVEIDPAHAQAFYDLIVGERDSP